MNWQEPADYLFTKDLTPHEWAWQFLRRNKDYQQAWAQYVDRFFQAKYPTTPLLIEPPVKLTSHYLLNDEVNKWGIGITYINPNIIHPANIEFATPLAVEMRTAKITVTFDLTKSIPPQLAKASQDLITIQNAKKNKAALQVEQTKHHPKKWPLYLRVLDAHLTSAPHSTIAKILFPDVPDKRGTKKVGDTLKQALKLVNGDYITIIETPTGIPFLGTKFFPDI
jgi:hypothetical protein